MCYLEVLCPKNLSIHIDKTGVQLQKIGDDWKIGFEDEDFGAVDPYGGFYVSA